MSTPTDSAPTPAGPGPAPVDDSDMVWVDMTSKNGKKFRVGYKKSADDHNNDDKPSADPTTAMPVTSAQDGPPDEKTATLVDGRPHEEWAPFQADCEVYWEYHDGVYYKPSPLVRIRIDIMEYQLGWNHFGYYNYKLQINCSVAWSYTFHDQEGDSYPLNCSRTGWHNVCFDSTAPTIIKVHAERWTPPPIL